MEDHSPSSHAGSGLDATGILSGRGGGGGGGSMVRGGVDSAAAAAAAAASMPLTELLRQLGRFGRLTVRFSSGFFRRCSLGVLLGIFLGDAFERALLGGGDWRVLAFVNEDFNLQHWGPQEIKVASSCGKSRVHFSSGGM